MKTRKLYSRAWSILAWLPLVMAAPALAESAQDWLQRIGTASRTVNYQGTFVHMCGGKMDVVDIVHRVDTQGVTERITAKSMGGRQVIRSADEAMCILPDQKTVMLESGSRASSGNAALDQLSGFENVNEAFYAVSMQGMDQIAEHETVMLKISPRDKFRYGYRLWLERDTALPLKFELVDAEGNGLEQGQFTEIEFPASIAAEAAAPSIDTTEFSWYRTNVADEVDDVTGANWRVANLPPGFELVFTESKAVAETSQPMEQLVYSDGLATISVFAERVGKGEETVEGQSNIGATNTWTTMIDDWVVTAMGSVPLETVRLVAVSATPETLPQ